MRASLELGRRVTLLRGGTKRVRAHRMPERFLSTKRVPLISRLSAHPERVHHPARLCLPAPAHRTAPSPQILPAVTPALHSCFPPFPTRHAA